MAVLDRVDGKVCVCGGGGGGEDPEEAAVRYTGGRYWPLISV